MRDEGMKEEDGRKSGMGVETRGGGEKKREMRKEEARPQGGGEEGK